MNPIQSILVTHVDQPPIISFQRHNRGTRAYRHVTWASHQRLVSTLWDIVQHSGARIYPLMLGYAAYPTPEYRSVVTEIRADQLFLDDVAAVAVAEAN